MEATLLEAVCTGWLVKLAESPELSAEPPPQAESVSTTPQTSSALKKLSALVRGEIFLFIRLRVVRSAVFIEETISYIQNKKPKEYSDKLSSGIDLIFPCSIYNG